MNHLASRWAVAVAVEATLGAAASEGGKALRDRSSLAILLIGEVVALELSAARLGGKSVGRALAGRGSGAEEGEDGDDGELHLGVVGFGGLV
jgi:hypothetical protein